MNFNKTQLLRYIIFFLSAIFIIVSVFILILAKRKSHEPVDKSVSLEYWGFDVPSEVMNVLIDKYEKENPDVKIKYIEKDFENAQDYRNLLLTRLRNGTGPDIFRLNGTWTSAFYPELSKTNYLTRTDVRHRFYNVYEKQIVSNKDEVIAIPIMYDGLTLYFNKDMFESAGLTPPKTWDELISVANALTVRNGNAIQRGGIAMGTVDNVANASDIIAILMIQNGVSIPNDLDTDKALSAIEYYADFSRKYKVWDDSMPNSLLSFSAQRVAMIFATSKQLQEVLKLNPTLNIGAAKIPQIPDLNGQTTNKTWASFWVESVSLDSTSKEQEEAWKFLDWLSQPEQQLERFSETTKYKPYGEIYSDMSLINNLLTSPYLSEIVRQAPYSTTAPVGEGAGNNEYVDLFHNVVNQFSGGQSGKGSIGVMKKLKEDYLKVKY